MSKTRICSLMFKLILFVLLVYGNLYYGPSLLLYTPTITWEVYRNTEMPADTDLQLMRHELVEHFQKDYPNDVITTHPGVYYLTINGTRIKYSRIYVYRSYNIIAVNIVVVFWYFPLNIVIVSAIIAPLAFLDSRESSYYTQQRRKILFYGTGEMYFWESVIKHFSQNKD